MDFDGSIQNTVSDSMFMSNYYDDETDSNRCDRERSPLNNGRYPSGSSY